MASPSRRTSRRHASLLLCRQARRLLLLAGVAATDAARVGVLVHGFDLGANDWEGVVWGSPRVGLLGRVPHGLLLARRFRADLLVIGSGGTCDEAGTSEAQRTLAHARAHVGELGALVPPHEVRALEWMLQRDVVLVEAARNTMEELVAARKLFEVRGIDTVFIVSSPTHAPRCLRDATRVFGDGGDGAGPVTTYVGRGSYRPTILASPCDTDFGRGGATVIEPQHRSDRPRWLEADDSLQLSGLAARALRIANGPDGSFNRKLDRLIRRFERAAQPSARAAPPDGAPPGHAGEHAGPRRCPGVLPPRALP